MSEADDTVKNGMAVREAEGGVWRSKMTKEKWVGEPNT
jgi:hypothetical protein